MTEDLLDAAAGRHGVLCARDAAAADVHPSTLASLVRTGRIVRVRRGAYVLSGPWHAAMPDARLALRTRAVLHARGVPGAATHQSALAVHALPVHAVPTTVVDATGPVSRNRTEAGLRLHPLASAPTVVDVDGCPTVDVATAVAQVLLRSGRTPGIVAADAALRRGTSVDALHAAVAALASTTHAAGRAGRMLATADPASESVGETLTRLLLRDQGWAVESQVRVADQGGHVVARVDLLVEGRVVVEFDGLVKYEGAQGRAALAAEKRREDALRALGYEVVRVVWSDLDRPGHVARSVRAALARAAGRPAAPRSARGDLDGRACSRRTG
ncbi:type IV toxin-antitoxin system AbiEi family antitoxin domain-containing protein [Phycicoccus sp. BSK3Z-2]|uniref:Type IV toxin-antitoxin system AbiEi family antitoxin domain-containing protein n=1 Tax=Phycicoccus avicenniae TaxID=2828860 RepID=A0A941D6B6_9MICO|nr:type IV toxin-antitoxin system AbiEi family antitoxin domain-containing protein [Phycicoccus avicenniae]MBR7741933.1 type IV toxin-antitoxin system AbiEi family antitoxin domain-containing protein [Phycicoccus avicenniae]